ncbi:MAG: SDR family oxidoreductase [Planctomycetota bacterium]|nr:SDR family oxidoreductase [Planctomycetota bacterium]
MLESFCLRGKTALVTGASRGLGRAMGLALAGAGADVAAVGRGEPALEAFCREARALGRRAFSIKMDLTDRKAIPEMVREAARELGGLDILLHAAGVTRRHRAEEFPDEDWEEVVNLNLSCAFTISREAGRLMLEKGSGRIILIASLLSFSGGILVPAYAASKGGVAQLVKALSNEWAGRGVNVNAIAPGYFRTDMTEPLFSDPARSRAILERIPIGRWGKPEDLAGAAVFLASPASAYVTGSVLVVDGGWMGR